MANLEVWTSVETKRAETNFMVEKAKAEALQGTRELNERLEKRVMEARTEKELQSQRSSTWAPVAVAAEAVRTEAEGRAAATLLIADAEKYKANAEAEARAFSGLKAAEVERAFLEARADGLKALVASCGNDPKVALSYLALEKGEFRALANSAASGIRDMKPKITIWAPDGNSAMSPFASLARGLPPLLDTIQDQTGFTLPKWAVDRVVPDVNAKK